MSTIAPLVKPRSWHAGRIMLALARYFDWSSQRMMSQMYIDGGIADLVFVSRAGYATEIEIKISVADWNADLKKMKWKRDRPHVARFFYAIPETLESSIPAWLPDYAGVLIVRKSGSGYDRVDERKAAVRRKALKMSDFDQAKMHESAYYRFWRQELRFLAGRLQR